MVNKRRVLAIVMSLMMVISVLPGMAFAAGGDGTGGGSGGGSGSASASEVKIKVNSGGSSFDVKLGETLKLESDVSGADEGSYHIHWAKTDGKKKINFIKKDSEIADDMISSNNATIKGNDAGTSEVTVSVVSGAQHEDSCTGEVLASKKLTINIIDETVKDQYAYGEQGKDLTKQSVEVISPSEITQLYPNADGQAADYYLNRFEKAFAADKPIAFVFKMGKGMGNQYDETAFLQSAVSNVAVYDETESKIVAGYIKGNLEFLGRNELDRSITLQIAAGTLEPGNYVLVFGKDMATKAGSDPLGVDVKFQFIVKGAGTEPAVPGDGDSNTEDPAVGTDPASGNTGEKTDPNTGSEKVSKTTPETGDDSNVWVWGAVMLAAMCTAGAALYRKKERQ